jgi:hypothetical protein
MRNYLTLALALLAFGTATMATAMAQSSLNPEQRTGTVANNARHGLGPLGPYGGYYDSYGRPGFYDYYGGPGFYRGYGWPYHRWHH